MMQSPPGTPSPSHYQAALGSVLGALVGDAAGAVLEFLGRDIDAADVGHALGMPGGGTWELAPGQITDDGELTMSLLRALAEATRLGSAPAECAASAYARWAASEPFDIGATTAASIGCLRNARWAARARDVSLATTMTEAALERCTGSKANGSLMRATPLGVWGSTRSDEELARAAALDARLSHPNPACVDAGVIYVLAIASLVRVPGDAARALEVARRWAETHACDEVRGWLDEGCSGVVVPYGPQIGFVRIAFSHAFRHLAAGTTFVDGMRETLAGGGDTDTNASIVGGLLGARWGAQAIPEEMRSAVLTCDTRLGKNPRPDDLHPRAVPDLVRTLVRTLLGSE